MFVTSMALTQNMYMQITYRLPQRIKGNNIEVFKGKGFIWKNMEHLNFLRRTSPIISPDCGGGKGLLKKVKGLFLNWMVTRHGNLIDVSPVSPSAEIPALWQFVIQLPEQQAASAGTMGFVSRGLLLPMPLWLGFLSFGIYYNLTWQLGGVSPWTGPGALSQTQTWNNRILEAQML